MQCHTTPDVRQGTIALGTFSKYSTFIMHNLETVIVIVYPGTLGREYVTHPLPVRAWQSFLPFKSGASDVPTNGE